MKEKYLPIGTVVLLKEATKTLMITGYCSSTPEAPEKVYDYVAGLFPEGGLAGFDVALFDHEQIGQIIHMGLENEEFKELNKRINDEMNKTTPLSDDLTSLPPFTPDNINLFLAQLHKNEENLKPIAEPTAFDEEVIKKPVFELPSLSGENNNSQSKIEKAVEEDEVESDKKVEAEGSIPTGQPVLQLQPIFDGDTSTGDTALASSNTPFGEIAGLERL